jgi:hypothetical protein
MCTVFGLVGYAGQKTNEEIALFFALLSNFKMIFPLNSMDR